MAITIKNLTPHGEPLEATFLPEMGMNMISFKKGDLEVIDQSTKGLFEERFAGLGALIGPHFHRKKSNLVPKVKDESLFPHIARIKAKGIQDPFSHGIGRYAPWRAEAKDDQIQAVLTGKDSWNGVPLSELEGQNFKMTFGAHLLPDGLHLDLGIVSDTDSLVGIHYYYHLPEGKGTITSKVQNKIIDHSEIKTIPSDWNFKPNLPPMNGSDSNSFPLEARKNKGAILENMAPLFSEPLVRASREKITSNMTAFIGGKLGFNEKQELIYSLEKETDCTFFPFPDPLNASILLDTGIYRLQTNYQCISQENCWQLYHPAGASYVCIEPLSAQDPRHPNLTVSSIKIHLQIL